MKWLEAITEMKLPPLVQGSHSGPEHGLCAMEMVAFMERLPHSDSPECTCGIIRGLVICINDILNDQDRQKLLPVLPELVDTVVEGKFMHDREHFISNTAARDFDHTYRRHYERDFERDHMRCGYRSRDFEEAHQLLHQGVGGAVKLIAKCVPPPHLADVLIGLLRDTLKIGQRKPRTEFAKPARVKELVKIEQVPLSKGQKAMKAAMLEMPPDFKYQIMKTAQGVSNFEKWMV